MYLFAVVDCFVETFINLFGKFFVAVRKSGSQFFSGKCMFDDTYRESGQIRLAFANSFFAMVRRDDNFCDLRFFKGILFQVFSFVEGIEQGKLTIDFRNRGF